MCAHRAPQRCASKAPKPVRHLRPAEPASQRKRLARSTASARQLIRASSQGPSQHGQVPSKTRKNAGVRFKRLRYFELRTHMDSDARREYEPATVLHPGETVAEYLEFNGWSQRDLARRAGLTPKTISEICAGKAPISPTTALAFEKVFRRPAHLWLNLQRQYDEAEARRRVFAKLSHWETWAKRFPFHEMIKRKLIEPGEEQRVDALLRFFGVSSPDSWQSVWQATN